MCGICGTVGRADKHELGIMTDAMAHRGPDGRGVRTFDGELPAGLGHRRLAILDPSPAGAQPMSLAGRWWITYNGEIYNFPELRRDLEAQGENFRTDCDTEILLRLFALEGEAMLKRLNGIYAFAIWDDQAQRMFVARDRLGVKPLYYVQQPGLFAFASELKVLLPFLPAVTLDPAGLADYLTFLWVPEPRTAFTGVMKLPAGHCARADRDGVTIEQYWDLEMAPEVRPAADWRDEVASTVSQSVRRQMLSDRPLGAFLSGGIDSSAIVAAMTAGAPQPPSTYTVGFAEQDLRHEIVPDDVVHARAVADRFGTDHEEIILEPDVLDLLPRAIWHLEEPVADPAAISTYLICREAGKRMPVMLSGVGGDELFAGYPRHLAYRISRLFDRVPGPMRNALETLAAPIGRPGAPGRLRGPRRNLWKYLRAAGLPELERYLSFLTYYPDQELRDLLSDDMAAEVAMHDPRAGHRRILERVVDADELAQILYLDTKTFLPNLNLTYTDKMSMAASVEVRVPLLDDEMVDLARRIPSDLKLTGTRRKYIFKRSQEGTLPSSVIWRAKAGFGAPVRSWLVDDLSPMIDDLLSASTIAERGLVDATVVAKMREQNEAGLADFSMQIYCLLCLELWSRQWTDQPWTFERLASESSAVPQPR
jgi:asparagine synthase (glutamine-hydrolysing)